MDSDGNAPKGTVYLIHLDEPLAHAGHYIGFATDLAVRLDQHSRTRWEPLDEPVVNPDGAVVTGRTIGLGSSFMGAVNAAGILWFLARKWENQDRYFERRLHNYKNSKRICPFCSGDVAYQRCKGD